MWEAVLQVRNTSGLVVIQPQPIFAEANHRIGLKRCLMPERKHVRGASRKENRMYEHIKESAQKSGKSTKRAKEIAARTVNKRK